MPEQPTHPTAAEGQKAQHLWHCAQGEPPSFQSVQRDMDLDYDIRTRLDADEVKRLHELLDVAEPSEPSSEPLQSSQPSSGPQSQSSAQSSSTPNSPLPEPSLSSVPCHEQAPRWLCYLGLLSSFSGKRKLNGSTFVLLDDPILGMTIQMEMVYRALRRFHYMTSLKPDSFEHQSSGRLMQQIVDIKAHIVSGQTNVPVDTWRADPAIAAVVAQACVDFSDSDFFRRLEADPNDALYLEAIAASLVPGSTSVRAFQAQEENKAKERSNSM